MACEPKQVVGAMGRVLFGLEQIIHVDGLLDLELLVVQEEAFNSRQLFKLRMLRRL
jgi:hypothetical protein